ncbi:helix-hairpin-helix domain-containing protein [Dehalogenimonas sp. 4OHTPN]|uniref:Helix-hairpin-helix domain-containing protein n=1 Tax=Dehalogenimonas sp. 4OHTPN TaxID=3166643 RepID=A0AAU8G9N1_9CHLR
MNTPLRRFGLIAASLAVAGLSACADPEMVEIYTPTAQPPLFANVAIEGSVALPGVYPLKAGDTIEDLLQAAGGASGGAVITLVVSGSSAAPQKVNLNTAEPWLLTALPGVGDSKAAAIVAYRAEHGLFVNIMELVKVPGFGQATFDSLKDLITVSE